MGSVLSHKRRFSSSAHCGAGLQGAKNTFTAQVAWVSAKLLPSTFLMVELRGEVASTSLTVFEVYQEGHFSGITRNDQLLRSLASDVYICDQCKFWPPGSSHLTWYRGFRIDHYCNWEKPINTTHSTHSSNRPMLALRSVDILISFNTAATFFPSPFVR